MRTKKYFNGPRMVGYPGGLSLTMKYFMVSILLLTIIRMPLAAQTQNHPVSFSVHQPANIPAQRMVREIFPLCNYIYFNLGSTDIPNRYVTLKPDQVKDFRMEQLELLSPKRLAGRSDLQLMAYYNVLNILSDRMIRDSTTTITLVGSSENGLEEGLGMAKSVKRYMVEVFKINATRIKTSSQPMPFASSVQLKEDEELDQLYEDFRGVSIESGSPSLLMEFQAGARAPLKPIEFVSLQEAPMDSYVTIQASGAREAFSSWSVEIKDRARNVQYVGGPFNQDEVSIPARLLLGDQSEGTYNLAMYGKPKKGKAVKRETTAHMVLWMPPTNEEGIRFSLVYPSRELKSNTLYKRYITDQVMPKIPRDATVIIHGYTDTLGEPSYNQRLSSERVNDVRKIMEAELSRLGRDDVSIRVYAFGENVFYSPFENMFPEERYYNRAVLIDITRAN